MKIIRIAIAAALGAMLLTACGETVSEKPEAIVLLTHDSFAVSD